MYCFWDRLYLTESIDAIRKIGNFAAHPMKSKSTGEIVDVEPGEAEWLVDVMYSLLELTFVQPVILENRKKDLDAKLEKYKKSRIISKQIN